MKLDYKDRVAFVLQLKILEKLYPEEADYYSRQRLAIEGGYSLHYSDLSESFSPELSLDDCREVLDILDMYRAINYSHERLGENSPFNEDQIKFPGFDGNNESRQHSYIRYFILDLGRFDELRGERKFPDFNSHRKMLPQYRGMLEVWKGRDAKDPYLNAESIQELLTFNNGLYNFYWTSGIFSINRWSDLCVSPSHSIKKTCN